MNELIKDVHIELVVFLRIQLRRPQFTQDVSGKLQSFFEVVLVLIDRSRILNRQGSLYQCFFHKEGALLDRTECLTENAVLLGR